MKDVETSSSPSPEKAYSEVYRGEPLGNREINTSRWPRDRLEAVVFFAGRGERVLDVGCGNGVVLYNLRHRFERLYGLELSEERVATARESLKGLDAEILAGNIEAGTPFESGFFDAITCADVIEHFVDVFRAVDEMARILKNGGRLVVNTPNVADIRRRFELLFGSFPSTAFGNEGFDTRTKGELHDGGHLHYFTYSMLEKLLRRSGFSEIQRYGFGSHGKLHNLYPSLLSPSCQIVGIK